MDIIKAHLARCKADHADWSSTDPSERERQGTVDAFYGDYRQGFPFRNYWVQFIPIKEEPTPHELIVQRKTTLKQTLWRPRIRSSESEYEKLKKHLNVDWLALLADARLGEQVALSEKAQHRVDRGLIDSSTLSIVLDDAIANFAEQIFGAQRKVEFVWRELIDPEHANTEPFVFWCREDKRKAVAKLQRAGLLNLKQVYDVQRGLQEPEERPTAILMLLEEATQQFMQRHYESKVAGLLAPCQQVPKHMRALKKEPEEPMSVRTWRKQSPRAKRATQAMQRSTPNIQIEPQQPSQSSQMPPRSPAELPESHFKRLVERETGLEAKET